MAGNGNVSAYDRHSKLMKLSKVITIMIRGESVNGTEIRKSCTFRMRGKNHFLVECFTSRSCFLFPFQFSHSTTNWNGKIMMKIEKLLSNAMNSVRFGATKGRGMRQKERKQRKSSTHPSTWIRKE